MRGNVVAIAVSPHVQVTVPVDSVSGKGADERPFTGLGIVCIRTSDHLGDDNLETGDIDTALGIHEAVDAIVLGRILHRSADSQFHIGRAALGESESHEGLGQVDGLKGEDTVLIGSGDGAAESLTACRYDGETVVGSDLVVETLLEHARSVIGHYLILSDLEGIEDRSRRLRGVEHGHLFIDAR